MTRTTFVLLACLVAAGCGGGRKVVVKPDDVLRLGSPDWNVRSEPKAAVAAPAP